MGGTGGVRGPLSVRDCGAGLFRREDAPRVLHSHDPSLIAVDGGTDALLFRDLVICLLSAG